MMDKGQNQKKAPKGFFYWIRIFLIVVQIGFCILGVHCELFPIIICVGGVLQTTRVHEVLLVLQVKLQSVFHPGF